MILQWSKWAAGLCQAIVSRSYHSQFHANHSIWPKMEKTRLSSQNLVLSSPWINSQVIPEDPWKTWVPRLRGIYIWYIIWDYDGLWSSPCFLVGVFSPPIIIKEQLGFANDNPSAQVPKLKLSHKCVEAKRSNSSATWSSVLQCGAPVR